MFCVYHMYFIITDIWVTIRCPTMSWLLPLVTPTEELYDVHGNLLAFSNEDSKYLNGGQLRPVTLSTGTNKSFFLSLWEKLEEFRWYYGSESRGIYRILVG